MTRSTLGDFYAYDPEIERTFRHLNRICRLALTGSQARSSLDSFLFHHSGSNLGDFESELSDSLFELSSIHTVDNMANANNRTLKELAAPDVVFQPLCIQYPDVDIPFELKSGLIHLPPKFHGLTGANPHKHLKEFHIICSILRPQEVPKNHVKLKAFPFSLDGGAKDWLYYLQPGSITSWDDMKKLFLEKFFLASKTTSIRKEICGIRQHPNESLYEY